MMAKKKGVLFVSGIDTEIGKTYVTGVLAKTLKEQGHHIITQKLIQTGMINPNSIAPDILVHRQMMAMDIQKVDKAYITCPYRLKKPASPHLALALEAMDLQLDHIKTATESLQSTYDKVLIEGAGGLLVPLQEDMLTLDYIAQQNYPIALVTTGRLGSINHTLLSLEAIDKRGLRLHSLIYNHIDDTDEQINQDTANYLFKHLKRYYPDSLWLSVKKNQPSFAMSDDLQALADF